MELWFNIVHFKPNLCPFKWLFCGEYGVYIHLQFVGNIWYCSLFINLCRKCAITAYETWGTF